MRRIVTISIGFLLLLGCGQPGPPSGVMKGKITYKNQPVNGCTLQLYPSSGTKQNYPIAVAQDGTFRTAGVPPGEYKIVVLPARVPPNLTEGMPPEKVAEVKEKLDKMQGGPPTIPFPDKYKKPEESDLKCTITTTEEPITLELKD